MRSRREVMSRVLEEMKRLYLEEGAGSTSIAKKFSLHVTTVLYWLKKAGVEIREPRKREELKRKVDPEVIKEMYESGETVANIARNLSVSSSTISYHLKRMNVKIRPRGSSPPSDVKRLYEAGLGAQEIADMFLVSKGTVKRWLKMLGVRMRSRSEALTMAWKRGRKKSTPRKWSREKTISDLRTVNEWHGKVTKSIASKYKGLVDACKAYFGSFNDALLAAGLPTNYGKVKIPPLTPEFAYWLGLMVGDGSVHSRGDILFSQTKRNEELVYYFAELTEKLFGRKARLSEIKGERFKSPNGRFYKRKDQVKARVGSIAISSWLRQNFGFGEAKFIPQFLLEASADVRASFLRGFFDADGCVGKYSISVTQKDRNLLMQIQKLLASLDIGSRINSYEKEARLSIYRLKDRKKFAQVIGFRLTRLQGKLLRFTHTSQNNKHPPLPSHAFHRVKHISSHIY